MPTFTSPTNLVRDLKARRKYGRMEEILDERENRADANNVYYGNVQACGGSEHNNESIMGKNSGDKKAKIAV